MGLVAIAVMAMALVVILAPIISKGAGAFVFRGTIEHRKVMSNVWNRGNPEAMAEAIAQTDAARQPIYDMISTFEAELKEMPRADRKPYKQPLRDLKKAISGLLGPAPGVRVRTPVLMRQQYGANRMDRAGIKLEEILMTEEWDYSNPDALGVLVKTPRAEQFAGTSLEPLFQTLENNVDAMLQPRLTFYWQFLIDTIHPETLTFSGVSAPRFSEPFI